MTPKKRISKEEFLQYVEAARRAPGRDEVKDVDVREINFTGCDISHVKIIAAHMSRARLIRVRMEDVHLQYADLSHALLIGAQAAGITLIGVNCTGADFSGADLRRAQLVTTTSWEKTWWTDEDYRRVYDVIEFPGMDEEEKRAAIDSMDEEELLNTGAVDPDELPGTPVEVRHETVLKDASFRFADLREARFEGVTLAGANFEGADLSGAVFSRVSFRGVNLKGARLDGADLRGVRGLTVEQLARTFLSEKTLLPGADRQSDDDKVRYDDEYPSELFDYHDDEYPSDLHGSDLQDGPDGLPL